MGLIEAVGDGPVGLDTAIFIYFIEEDPRYLHLLEELFARIDTGALAAVTSGVTLLEVLVVPLREGNEILAARYEALLTRSRGLSMRELDRPLLRAAARLRASFGLKTPDALQVAATLSSQCTTFLTNDRRLPTVPRMKTLQLEDFLEGC